MVIDGVSERVDNDVNDGTVAVASMSSHRFSNRRPQTFLYGGASVGDAA